MIVSAPAPKSELQVLVDQAKSPTKLQGRAALSFAIRLLELFGQRYIYSIRLKLGENSQEIFDQVHRSFLEIQKRLEHGHQGFTQLLCPETSRLIEKFRIGSQSDLELFSLLKERSIGILPFPQRMILYYEAPDLESLKKTEKVRQRAFHTLLNSLKLENKEEEKAIYSNPVSMPLPIKISNEDEMGMTKLYFGSGALVYDRKTVYFSDLLRMWSSFSPQNKEKVEEFLKLLSSRSWAAEPEQNNIQAFMNFSEIQFQNFLVCCSLEAIQKNLNMQFSPFVYAELEKRFLSSERIRSDFSYFSVDMQKFYELDLSKFDRDSTPLLRSFQLFYFLKWNFDIKNEDEQALLVILINMKNNWKETSMPLFKSRRFKQPQFDMALRDAFRNSWDGFLKVLQLSTQTIVSFSNPSSSDLLLLGSSDCWDFFLFLFQNPNRDYFVQILIELKNLPNFKMSLNTVLEFCRKNSGLEKDSKINWVAFFPKKYKEIIQFLNQNQIPIQESQYLFFDPPIDLNSEMAGLLDKWEEKADEFIQLISQFKFNREREYCSMLRQHIFKSNKLILDLLKDVSAIGVECTEEFIYEVLSAKGPIFGEEDIPSNEERIQAVEITFMIQKKFHFSSTQAFFLYIEILRAVTKKQSKQIWRIYLVIDQLIAFCPAFRKDDIYFLLLYPSDSSPLQVESLVWLRMNWATNKEQLNRFVIDQEIYQGIIQEIEKFVFALAANCSDIYAADKFKASCQHSLLSAFFPPLQPLGDYFRIINITQADGARWGESVWNTHMGQIKSLLGSSEIGVYLNWSVLKNQPVLYITFAAIRKKMAYSVFVPIGISIEELSSDPRKKTFYGLLAALSSQVLREIAEESPSKKDLETPETWEKCLIGVKQTIDGYAKELNLAQFSEDPVKKLWLFFQKVKLSYRHLFLDMVTGRKIPDLPSYEPQVVAAQGHIFPSHPRGSLLPQPLLELVKNCECYLPDATPEAIKSYQDIFTNITDAPQELKLHLHLPNIQDIPVTYMVETSDKLTKQSENFRERQRSSARNEVAPPVELEQGRYVTLRAGAARIPLRYPPEAIQNLDTFELYFDFHNLLLKSACFYAST
jgi:hypothetical protein